MKSVLVFVLESSEVIERFSARDTAALTLPGSFLYSCCSAHSLIQAHHKDHHHHGCHQPLKEDLQQSWRSGREGSHFPSSGEVWDGHTIPERRQGQGGGAKKPPLEIALGVFFPLARGRFVKVLFFCMLHRSF